MNSIENDINPKNVNYSDIRNQYSFELLKKDNESTKNDNNIINFFQNHNFDNDMQSLLENIKLDIKSQHSSLSKSNKKEQNNVKGKTVTKYRNFIKQKLFDYTPRDSKSLILGNDKKKLTNNNALNNFIANEAYNNLEQVKNGKQRYDDNRNDSIKNQLLATIISYNSKLPDELHITPINSCDRKDQQIKDKIIKNERDVVLNAVKKIDQAIKNRTANNDYKLVDIIKNLIPPNYLNDALQNNLYRETKKELDILLANNTQKYAGIANIVKELPGEYTNEDVKKILNMQLYQNQSYKDLQSSYDMLFNYTKHFEDLFLVNKNNEVQIIDKELFQYALEQERGHSEDYLHYSITYPSEELQDEMKKISKTDDRFYLVVSSTKDACKRCEHKMIDVNQALYNQITKSSTMKDVKCKTIYFGSKQETDVYNERLSVRSYKSNNTDRTLSSTDKMLINIQFDEQSKSGYSSVNTKNLASPIPKDSSLFFESSNLIQKTSLDAYNNVKNKEKNKENEIEKSISRK